RQQDIAKADADQPADDDVLRFPQAAGGEGANQWFHVTLSEGRNRIVRRLWESQNIVVSRLIRIRFGDILLPPHIKARTYQELTAEERDALLASVGLPTEAPAPRPAPRSRGSDGKWRGR
ncbi:MAG: hypothetical protein ACKN9T_03405, partial [Candidatus Methylumidiphilus sp.]